MEMTKERKVLAGILCAGLSALGLDRFVLSAPESASADIGVQAAAADPSLTSELLSGEAGEEDPEVGEHKTLPSFTGLNDRLASLQPAQAAQTDDGAQAADPFAVPEGWNATQQQAVAAPSPTEQKTNVDEAFLKAHKLEAVTTGVKPVAVVNNKFLKLGDELNGYLLVRINRRWVLWESIEGGHKVIMQLDD